MNKSLKSVALAFMLAVVIAVSGCSNTPDTVEDPLSAYGIDGVLPFETVSPESVIATPSPSPTINPDELEPDTDYGRQWQSDTSGVDNADDDDYDDYISPTATPRPASAATSTPRPTTAASAALYERLEYGDTGSAVSQLQRRLRNLGYYTGSVDGDYGTGTASAVRLFQSIMGFTQTGIATVAVQEALFNASAPAYSATPAPTARPTATPRPTAQPSQSGYTRLQRGDSGTAVRQLQTRLRTLGYYTGTVDGIYGAGTASAVMRFQNALGLAQTGVATIAVQTSLFSSSAPYY
ncbi:MAG: peptidoglycan-binding protein, partial [Clostridia bacterium]|nr:peptidoglycan-binding protein [Clostridia bacterium]